MKTFINDNFLLKNKTAETLYHGYAKDMPIFDFHCHLPVAEIASNKQFRSITEMWLDYDHYKWRIMRTAGLSEYLVTGGRFDESQDKIRFKSFAAVLPQALGNPVYHWTHLELLRCFNIDEILCLENSEHVYNEINEIISNPNFSAQEIIKKFNVKYIGTTDDPLDTLEHHKKLLDNTFSCEVKPSFRPDKAIKIEQDGFLDYINKMAETTNTTISNFEDFISILKKQFEEFDKIGCRISDHGLDEFVFTKKTSSDIASRIFNKRVKNKSIDEKEVIAYKSYIMQTLAMWYSDHKWVMMLHIGAMRNNNSKMFDLLGADTGFDSISDQCYAVMLSNFLDALCKEDKLPKTILFCLNPKDNDMLATMIGNFQAEGIFGKIQLGSGWWFNDQQDGMKKQMISLANANLLPLFVGMVTDSRSFLSYPRHEYFRRILCNIIGTWATNSEIPNDIEYLGGIIKNISYNNAVHYFLS